MPKKVKPVAEVVSSTIQSNSKLIRTRDGEVYKICKASAWGHYLAPAQDPDGIDVSKEDLEGIKLLPDFPRLPSALWSPYIELCFHLCPTMGKLDNKFHDSQLEVGVCLLRKVDDLTQWKIVVPKQKVSGASVKADLTKNIDIITGEEYDQFPPFGWAHAGSSHSHNTMGAFFSSVDDKSELNVPGMHIVVGHIDHKKQTYEWAASIVLQGMRKLVELKDVVDIDHTVGATFHPKVLDYVEKISERNKELLMQAINRPTYGPGFKNWRKPGLTSDEEIALDILSIKDVSKVAGDDWEDSKYWSDWGWGETGKSWTVYPPAKKSDYDDIKNLLFDENGKPTSFYHGLDKNNSDIFDGGYDEVPLAFLSEAVNECFKHGWSLDDILETIAETKADFDEENGDDEIITFRDSAIQKIDETDEENL